MQPESSGYVAAQASRALALQYAGVQASVCPPVTRSRYAAICLTTGSALATAMMHSKMPPASQP